MLTDIEKALVEELINEGMQLKSLLSKLEPKDLLKFMRIRFKMTQKELAELAGVPRSTVVRIEKGDMAPTFAMMKKLFAAMECDLLLIPLPHLHPDLILQRQAKKVAEKRVRYLKGTMALEAQKPSKKWEKKLLEQEISHVLEKGSGLWDENSNT
ncbi:MAG: hypothetical protein K940chlam9_00906 [Chlamydiae bacterium]|nr:hypothetical protein [Chlamydiota bacterium]